MYALYWMDATGAHLLMLKTSHAQPPPIWYKVRIALLTNNFEAMSYREVLPGVYSPSKAELGLQEEPTPEEVDRENREFIVLMIIVGVVVLALLTYIISEMYITPFVDLSI